MLQRDNYSKDLCFRYFPRFQIQQAISFAQQKSPLLFLGVSSQFLKAIQETKSINFVECIIPITLLTLSMLRKQLPLGKRLTQKWKIGCWHIFFVLCSFFSFDLCHYFYSTIFNPIDIPFRRMETNFKLSELTGNLQYVNPEIQWYDL